MGAIFSFMGQKLVPGEEKTNLLFLGLNHKYADSTSANIKYISGVKTSWEVVWEQMSKR